MKLLSLIISATLLSGCGIGYVRIEGFAQGGNYSAVFKSPRGLKPTAAKDSIEDILHQIDTSLSGYNRGSLLSRINAGEDPVLNRHLLCNFLLSGEIQCESGGAFDPAAAPLFDLWGFGFRSGNQAIITQAQIDSAKAISGIDHFLLEEREDGLHLVREDSRCKLNFNAIAQGYTCDELGRFLERHGCEDYLVDVGGEILCRGLNPYGEKWSIGVETSEDNLTDEHNPVKDTLHVTDCAVVTSGNYRKFYEVDGQRFSHTVDPRTGRPVTHQMLSATVIVPVFTEDGSRTENPCALADAYATWSMVEGRIVK